MTRWHVYGGHQPPTSAAVEQGVAGTWMAAVVGPTDTAPESFDLATAYGPVMADGLGPLPYLASFTYRPTPGEVDALCERHRWTG